MNTRDRYLATLAFEPVDRPPLYECAYWPNVIANWGDQGLPHRPGQAADEPDVRAAVGMDRPVEIMPLRTRHICPPCPEELIEDHPDWRLIRNNSGAIVRVLKNATGFPEFVRGAVQSRDDWERVKAGFQPTIEGRVPADWEQLVAGWRTREHPLCGNQSEPWLNLIELFGPEALLMLFHDDPAWLKEMIRFLGDFFIALIDQVLRQVKPVPDICIVGGDFCYKHGPLMSPDAFREFLFPEFRRIIDVYRSHGVPNVMMHTDGDCRALIPMFIEAGVTAVHPFEVTNGQSIVAVREAYPRLGIFGGIDKREVAKGPAAIDRELARCAIAAMVAHGGYIPYMDHAVPPEVTWEDFVYYRRKLNGLVRGGGR